MEAPTYDHNLERLIQLGIALSAERNHDRLLETILDEAQRLTNADGGTIYLLNEADELEFAIINNRTLGIKRRGSSGEKITLPALPLYDPRTGAPLEKNVASYAAIHKQTINIDDAYSEEGDFDFSGTRKFDRQTGYHSQSFLTIPMRERKKGEVIGVLQLINAKNPADGSTLPFHEYVVAPVEALSSQAAVAIENHNLLDCLAAPVGSYHQPRGRRYRCQVAVYRRPPRENRWHRVPARTDQGADVGSREIYGHRRYFRSAYSLGPTL